MLSYYNYNLAAKKEWPYKRELSYQLNSSEYDQIYFLSQFDRVYLTNIFNFDYCITRVILAHFLNE
jgi:hypothetical protein